MIRIGIVHETLAYGSVTQSPNAYIQGIVAMSTSQFVGKKPGEEVDDTVASEYRSGLGTVAYAMGTQFHLLIYVVAAQRRSQNPTGDSLQKT